jgi:hypothetical protein
MTCSINSKNNESGLIPLAILHHHHQPLASEIPTLDLNPTPVADRAISCSFYLPITYLGFGPFTRGQARVLACRKKIRKK